MESILETKASTLLEFFAGDFSPTITVMRGGPAFEPRRSRLIHRCRLNMWRRQPQSPNPNRR